MRSSLTTTASLIGILGSSLLLTGCYVVPVNPSPAPAPAVVVLPVPDLQVVARLYPANEEASATGVLQGLVINRRNGKGHFSLFAHGEQMSGEATRLANSKSGVANASGARGTYVQCNYEMTSPQQGSGSCAFSNGARYTLHLGG